MGYTIAICDDDKAMADKLTASLKNEFMKAGRNDVIIDYYDTGVQLLEALKNKMYKAVLLDINMSKGTTFHTLRRKQKAGKHNMRCSFPLFFCPYIYILYFVAFEMHTPNL